MTALLRARADRERQSRAVGSQFASRIGLFLRVGDFESAYDRMRGMLVQFLAEPRKVSYGKVVVSVDVAGAPLRWSG
jgi:hypothetical protein